MALSKPTVAAVRALVTSSSCDDVIEALIDDAALLAEGCTVLAGYDENRQVAIIKYLAAHLIVSRGEGTGRGQVTQEALGDANRSYSAPVGSNLLSTTFGQQAAAFDPSGCVANIGKIRARLYAL